ncbi:VOC family protein [Kibdelosporangium persicum]|uniref:VOC domain-containing protein n=1 Tax=Kibdelosporangium persicum TaxID=2698649 RepID=A0ABX2FHG3_9PSEU|nr:VOC family protein [Kibdelosporangium persicum]NRN70310.1 VOC domain-containing protein [Kibdelosporangium persicum]
MSGEVNWFELAVDDTSKAAKFYGAVLGWQTQPFEGQDYHLVTNGAAGAIAPKSAELPASRVYFQVDDLDATLAKIGELGGKPGDAAPVPGFGRIAHCQDDQGTSFSLYEQG